jgi:5-methylcytosine-specific restriction protein B
MSKVVWEDVQEKVNSILELAGYPSKWIKFVWNKVEKFELYQLDTWNEYRSDIEFIDVHIRIAVLIQFYLEFKTSNKDNDFDDLLYRLGHPFTRTDNIYIFFLREYMEVDFYRLRSFCKSNLNFHNPANNEELNTLISEGICEFAEKIYREKLNHILSIIFINKSNLFKTLLCNHADNINDAILSTVDTNELIYNNKKSWDWLTIKSDIDLNRPFSEITFNLLDEIDANPKKSDDFFKDNQEEIQTYIEIPLQNIFNKVCHEIPKNILEIISGKHINYWSPDNDYCSAYIYGENTELLLFITENNVSYAFVILEDSEYKQKFIDNCKNNFEFLRRNPKFKEAINLYLLSSIDLPENWDIDINKQSFAQIIGESHIAFQPHESLRKDILLDSSFEEIVQNISSFFKSISILIILAFADDLMNLIKENCKDNLDDCDYTIDQFLLDTSITPEELDRYEKTIKRKKQIIFAGSPGTGKTFIAQKFAKYLTSAQDGYFDLVQFHPSYTYEDFMQGLKPEIKDGNLTYNYAEGRFIRFCEKAQTEYQDIPCVFIIDEINRANISQVFGELMYLLEYRNEKLTLSSGKTLTIPDNVLIIGTMNTADRSIALIDHALRRRFAFIKITPNYQSLRNKFQDSDFPIEKLITVLEGLNQKICEVMGSNDYELGTSFFMTDNLSEEIENIWQTEVEPYLEEYFFDNQSLEIIESFRWINVQKQIY